MHRHGYKGRKFGRETDQRNALLRGLMCSLIENHSITTTLAKAKELRRHTEKMVTLGRRADLASRRLLIARLGSMTTTDHLIATIVPSLKRDSGYLRITRAGFRKGDNTEMATISFVDDIISQSGPTLSETGATRAASKMPSTKETPAKNKETK